VILSNFQDVALIPIEKDDKTYKPRGAGELVFISNQTKKTRVKKNFFSNDRIINF